LAVVRIKVGIMNEAFKEILYHALGYFVSFIFAIVIFSFLQRGFLFKFIKVKASLGRKVLVRIKEVNHWIYEVGHWNEGDLIFGGKKARKRINNTKSEHIYRSLGISWIDIDSKKYNIISPADNEAIVGFDPEKQESLVTRALYKPPLDDNMKKIMMLLAFITLAGVGLTLYFVYNMNNMLGVLTQTIENLRAGLVVPTG